MADGLPATVGLLGGGVIGGGWAARFLLHGVDVRVYDPSPDAARTIDATVGNARRALRRLTAVPLPPEGVLTHVGSVEEAVAGAGFVQESAPEREDLKRGLLATASAAAAPDVVIATSTSGLLPSRLGVDMTRPERFVVGHPFNPVYLLPLVEVVGAPGVDPGAVSRAADVYRGLGMEPLVLRREVDGFVADRLLEALWREALWLVADEVATVEQIDDAIRFGAGLRWSFMGTFLTYRIAGGEAGIRHFMAQFGPSLQWPWSKLTDVPELTEELLDTLVTQSDAQAAGRSIRELERLRDDCLVAVIQGLRAHGEGAGAVLRAHEDRLLDAGTAARPLALDDFDLSRPLRLHEARILPEWIDYNGHANDSRYLQVAGDALEPLLRLVGADVAYRAATGSWFTVETHLVFRQAAVLDDRVHVTTQVLGLDPKRLHLLQTLHRSDDDTVLATAEALYVHVGAETGRAVPAGADVLEGLGRIARAHADLPRPEAAGRRISLERART